MSLLDRFFGSDEESTDSATGRGAEDAGSNPDGPRQDEGTGSGSRDADRQVPSRVEQMMGETGHEEWLADDPPRDPHPYQLALSTSDDGTCPLEDCDGNVVTRNVTRGSTESITGEVSANAVLGGKVAGNSGESISVPSELNSCSDRQCALYLDTEKAFEILAANEEDRYVEELTSKDEIEALAQKALELKRFGLDDDSAVDQTSAVESATSETSQEDENAGVEAEGGTSVN